MNEEAALVVPARFLGRIQPHGHEIRPARVVERRHAALRTTAGVDDEVFDRGCSSPVDRSVVMAKLAAKKRAASKPSQFGLPEKARAKEARKQPGSSPRPDRGHAISAVRLAKKHHKAGELSKSDDTRIRRTAHRILEKD